MISRLWKTPSNISRRRYIIRHDICHRLWGHSEWGVSWGLTVDIDLDYIFNGYYPYPIMCLVHFYVKTILFRLLSGLWVGRITFVLKSLILGIVNWQKRHAVGHTHGKGFLFVGILNGLLFLRLFLLWPLFSAFGSFPQANVGPVHLRGDHLVGSDNFI